jgi:thiosulfate dehydrogenase (quinone) large subunit
MSTYLLSGPEWLALLRIGLGLWWLESWRHKDKRGWLRHGSGISWAGAVASEHRWPVVRSAFDRLVRPRPRLVAYGLITAELAIGLGLALGLCTPLAAAAGLALNLMFFTLMIHDWAEQGQNAMMALISVVVIGAQGWQTWSLDRLIGLC